MSDIILFENAGVLDGRADGRLEDHHVLVEDGRIKEVSGKPLRITKGRRIDLKGRTLMPGLIDCHVHVCAALVNMNQNMLLPNETVAYHAARIMRGMLDRGFTTVRDVGGGTFALAEAVEDHLIPGPRLFVSGKALSQSGGHGDMRTRYDDRDPKDWPKRLGALGRICDGVAEVRKAAREEIKQGAHFIKIMANGGVASPNDPIIFLGFSREEIIAAVEEAANANTYVAAHLYTDQAIRRAVECGVHSLEHCNLIESETAAFAAARGAIACPTLVTYEYLKLEGAELGLPPVSIAKVDDVRLKGLESLEIMRNAGLPMALGTDLLGAMHRHQSEEFVIRSRILPAIEVIRSTTTVAAKLLRQEGKLGIIAPGAHADLIVVDGDPLMDMRLLTNQGAHIPMIMKAGRFHKDRLA